MDSASSEPKQLGSGRPERYEIDNWGPSSPPTYTLLKTFDASHIFSKNPHKYDRLIAQEDGYSKDDSVFSNTGINRHRSEVDVQHRVRTRSNSLTSLDVIALEIAPGSPQLMAPELDDSNSMVASSNRADNMYRRCSLDHMADYYSRRSSDAAVTAIWEPSSQSHGQSFSPKPTVTSAVASYKPDKKKVFGEHHLTDIMMTAAFKEPLTSSKEEETRSKDRRYSTLGIESPTTSKELHASSRPRRMSLPETVNMVKDVQTSSVGEDVSIHVATVQPEPRRLFGIGPLYHPLPETVVEGVVQDGPLMSRVKKEGLGPGSEDPTRKRTGKKTAPTKAEMNTWAPFSM